MSEKEEAIALANKLLDEPNCDPDDDLRLLSRQFLRAIEREGKPKQCNHEEMSKELGDK